MANQPLAIDLYVLFLMACLFMANNTYAPFSNLVSKVSSFHIQCMQNIGDINTA
ncbi:hypothetical protein [Leuconostoc gasicomitatum]|uniref:hypothetical protein n=1 Tax=Leuconostoc gasicomitatum TaxID=115778 RepID=UPI0018776D04|nr:hypothetical protein [Leuconostoc gasicomitatum]